MYIAPKFWLGNDSSSENFGAALAQYTKAEAGTGFSAYSSSMREELGLPSLVQIQEGVAVVHISGDLISGEAGYMALFGSVGYDDLRDALMQALVSPEVGSILLHVNSGGGMVAGCEDFAAFLKQVAAYKPLTTYADGCMCSAAYWIGSHGQYISTNRTATIGSLGVVMIHFDESQTFAAEGIRPTVVRSGKYKMLTNSVEPLSAVALEELQTKADVIYSVFIESVAANRKVTYAVADSQMGQGREFLGQAALDVGLVDALMSYDEAFNYAKSLDKTRLDRNNPQKPLGVPGMKVTLTTAQLAALAAGATLPMMGIDPATTEITNMPVPPVMASITVDALAALEAKLATASAAQAGLVNAQAALGHSEATVARLKAENETVTAQAAAMLAIVQASVASMGIALGSTVETASMTAAQAVAKHAELAVPFNTKFPGGRLSASAGVPTQTAAQPNLAYLNLIKSGPKAAK